MATRVWRACLSGWVLALGAWFAPARVSADEVRMLCDFEEPSDVSAWEVTSGIPRLVTTGVTHGERALELVFDPGGRYGAAYMTWRRVVPDWSSYDALVLDVHNPSDRPMRATVLIADQAWMAGGRSYWNRHNGSTTFAPGAGQWVIPVEGLYRGEAGSRNNDIKRNIDANRIARLDFGFGAPGSEGKVIVDGLRLVRADRQEGVWAFDFGPPSQAVMMGWTDVTQDTRYTPERGYGWGPRGGSPWRGAARDTTFGPALLRDFCEAGGYNFRVDVPVGRYRCTVFYENSGYWGGEQAKHGLRRIRVDGEPVWSETRADGPAHALYRFENVEPVEADVWDTYMAAELARPAEFEVSAGAGGLTLRFEADKTWGSKISGLVLRRVGDAEAEGWVSRQRELLAKEFRGKAVCLDREPEGTPDRVPGPGKPGLLVWPVGIEDTITPRSRPADSADAVPRLSAVAVKGEWEPLGLAVCSPVRDLGDVPVRLSDLTGPEGAVLPAVVSRVFYNTSRGFNSIAYRIRPHTLRPCRLVPLSKGVTRMLVVTVEVPEEAPAGVYRGTLTLGREADGAVRRAIPCEVTVRDVVLKRETDFLMGYFGLMPPSLLPAESRWDVLDETLGLLRSHGMNAVSGGPSWRLTGWDDGKPIVDFGEMDRFFALLRKHGFRRPLNGYGGARFRGLHTRYEMGPVGEKVAKESGLPYEEVLMRAWRAVDEHARKNDWPLIYYAMCDETRVRSQAERELAFMNQMARVSKAFPETVRTSGSYSVDFEKRPDNPEDLLLWHQRFFGALDISSLNNHDSDVLAEAARLGKDIHIYNQGRTRYSFGLYQWSEFRKGVKARWQWHLNILHGYQFFDLDGREPDTAMICYGRKAIYPTIDFERCREGAEDFYLYAQLQEVTDAAAAKRPDDPAVGAGRELLGKLTEGIQVNQRRPPAGYDAQRIKLRVIEAIEAIDK